MDLQEIVDELRERIARLEAARPRARRAYNQQETARELNMSVNKLREEQRLGRIKGTRNGRIWTFTDEELQRYIAGQANA
jgi:hypothetical protein